MSKEASGLEGEAPGPLEWPRHSSVLVAEIRQAQMQRMPYMLVYGGLEMENPSVFASSET